MKQRKKEQGVVFSHMEEMMPIICESIASGRSVELSPRGVSMLPMLRQGKDSVILSRIDRPIRKYDILFYQRTDGAYVLHRVVKAGREYTLIGDNQFALEHGITDGQAIAVVTAFRRGERLYSTRFFPYRIYSVCWHHSRPIRHLFRRGVGKLRRMLHGR